MDLEFNSQEELFNRVKPALHTKINELKQFNNLCVSKEDIWNYLIKVKWINAKDLTLSDIVSDIMHIESESLERFIKEV